MDKVELVKVFDEDFRYIGEDTRDHVHLKGKWHETFHCWFMDEQSIYIQKRSASKSDFPSLFDITAAGHLEADETVEDGVREIEEELGIQVSFSDLLSVGVVKDIIKLPNFHDYEFAHVYLYKGSFHPEEFLLQKEEVDSIYAIHKREFIDLCLQRIEVVEGRHVVSGTFMDIRLTDFVPHQHTYFETIAKKLKVV